MISENYYLVKRDLKDNGIIQQVNMIQGEEVVTHPLPCQYPLQKNEMFNCAAMNITNDGYIMIIVENIVFKGHLTLAQSKSITCIDEATFKGMKTKKYSRMR